MNDTQLRETLEKFGKKKNYELFVLFGSHAKGTAGSNSDLDLAIYSRKPLDLLKLTGELMVETHENNIDLVDMKHCDPAVGIRVLEEGDFIVRKPGALGTIGSYICRRFADTKKFRDAVRRDIDLQTLVEGKLQHMVENLRELETIHQRGLDHYKSTKSDRKLAERYLQETIEAASDINSHVLVEEKHGAPRDYFSGFKKMGEARVIPHTLAEALTPAAGLRNRLVHEYDELDDVLVFKGVGEALRLFPQYIEAIQKKIG